MKTLSAQRLAVGALVLSLSFPLLACDYAIYNSSYVCPTEDGQGEELELSVVKENGFDVVTVRDGQYDQAFVSDTSKYQETPIGRTIGSCNFKKMIFDIYSGSGNKTVHSQIHMTGAGAIAKEIWVSKFVKHPNQSQIVKTYVCTKKK